MKRRVREVIVVEGRYDKNTLSQVVDATILETGGFGIFRDKAMTAFLRRLAEDVPSIVILFTHFPCRRLAETWWLSILASHQKGYCMGSHTFSSASEP